ncbi:HTH_Tnp_Tc3_2 domain-containing protein [Trichonephila clavipes]|nr:HTH_Tnp_Tc3_2 domain-containing protein [Trichonephila clavipes]
MLLESPEKRCKAVESITKQEMLDVDQGQGRPTRHSHQLMTVYTVNSPSKQNRECYAAAKTVAFSNRTGGCPAKQYVIGFMREALCTANGLHSIDPTPRAARRRWAAEHRDWEQHDWSQVLFTDESLFSLECDTRRVLVWRDRGTRNNPAFVRERSQYRRAGWMV